MCRLRLTLCLLAMLLAMAPLAARAIHVETPDLVQITTADSTEVGRASHADASNVMVFHADGDLLGNGNQVSQIFAFDQGKRANSGVVGLTQLTSGSLPSRNPSAVDRASVYAFESRNDFLGTGLAGWQIFIARDPRPAIGRGPLTQLTRAVGESTMPLLAGKYVVFESTIDLLQRGLPAGRYLYRALLSQVGGSSCPGYPCPSNPGLEIVADVPAGGASINASGETVVFASRGDASGDGLANGSLQIFLRRFPDPPVRLTQGLGDSQNPQISRDGSAVVFESTADLLGTGAGRSQIYLIDLTTTPPTLGQLTFGTDGDSVHPAVTGTADRVVFLSTARLTGDDTFGKRQVFFLERWGPRLTQVTSDPRDQGLPTINLAFVVFPSASDILGIGDDAPHLYLVNTQKTVGNLPPKPTATPTATPQVATPTPTSTPTSTAATPTGAATPPGGAPTLPNEQATPSAGAAPVTPTAPASPLETPTPTKTSTKATKTATPKATRTATPTPKPSPTLLPPPQSAPRALLGCHDAIARALSSRLRDAEQVVKRCLDLGLACAERPSAAREACRLAARPACLRAIDRWRTISRVRADAAIRTACGDGRIVPGELTGPLGLAFAEAAESCETRYDGGAATPEALSRCVQNLLQCRIEHLVGAALPRAPELLAALGAPSLSCAASEGPPAPALDGARTASRCQSVAARSALGVVRDLLALNAKCSRRLLACRFASDPSRACPPRVLAQCATRFAAITEAVHATKRRTAVLQRCAVVPSGALTEHEGLAFGRNETFCEAVGVTPLLGPTSVAECTIRLAQCAAREIVATAFPRLSSVMQAVPADFHCPIMPTDP